jgi:hypothetical protein
VNKKSTKVVMSLAVLALTVIVANAQYRNTQVPFNYKTFLLSIRRDTVSR